MKISIFKLREIIAETLVSINSRSKTEMLLKKLEEPITTLWQTFMDYNFKNEAHPQKTTPDDNQVGHYSDEDVWQRQVQYASEELKNEVIAAVEKVQKKLYNNEYVKDIRNNDMPQRKWQ